MTEPVKMADEPSKRKAVDWEGVEKAFRAGAQTLRQIGDEFGVSHVSIQRRGKDYGWERGERVRVNAPRPDPTPREETPPEDVRHPVCVVDLDEMESLGFVYAICIDTGVERLFKVGLSSSPIQRALSHQVSLPFEARIAISYFVPNMRSEERVLHYAFADKFVRGEWFRLDDADLDFMASRARLV